MKLKSLILITISLVSTSVFSQGLSSVDYSLGIGSSYRSLINTDGTISSDDIINLRDSLGSSRNNWSVGVNLNKRLSTNVFLRTGLRLSTMSYFVTKDDGLRWPTQHNGNGGFDPFGDPGEPFATNSITLSRAYWFLEVPIMFRVEKQCNKFSPYIEAGVSAQYYLSTRFIQETDNSKEGNFSNEEEVNALNFFGNISAGSNYQLKKSLQLFAQANFSHQINKLSDTPVSERLYAYGIEIGVRKMFSAGE